MHVVFAMAADGGAHPAHPGPRSGVLGAAVLGPAGMLDLLASRLGLSGPPVPPVVRIAAWQAKLEAAAADAPRFFSGSLSVDAFATARHLLSWRDELVEAGWSPRAARGAAGRVADVTAAELSPPRLPRGRADLMREVEASLAGGASPDVERVEVVGGAALLPPAWRRIIGALAEAGAVVTERRIARAARHDCDLGRVRGFLAGGRVEPLVGDGSLALLESRTAIMAAEAIADWMALDPTSGAGTVFVVPGGDGALLDEALARRGLPTLGASPRSPHRGALQLLSLAFSVAWAPFDPQKLVELLLLPRPPVDPWAARLLSDALCREPGVGGAAWRTAWEAVEIGLAERGAGGTHARTVEDWRGWTRVGVHDRGAGIPAAEAAEICGRVRRWALATDGGTRDPLLLQTVGAADALSRAFGLLRRSLVPATQVEGMIDVAVGEGLPDPTRHAEEGAPRCVTRPGGVWDRVARLVWWGFSGPASTTRSTWTTGEAAELAAAGCDLDPPAEARRREAADWERAVLAADEALVLVTPSLDRGAEPAPHPLAHRLAPILAGPGRRAILVDAESLLDVGEVRLAGREVRRRSCPGAGPPEACAVWTLPPSLAEAVDGRGETASSLQDLVECQFRWLLRHVGGLRAGGALAIPGRERLLGNVAHELAQAVFSEGAVPDPAEVLEAATDRIDGLIDRIAAPLRLPGSSGELAFARVRIPASLASLAQILRERRLSVVGIELERRRTVDGLPVRGRIDLVVRTTDGVEAAVDLKWTGSRVRRRREVEDGRAVQLAVYARLLSPGGGADAGYYLLRQRELLAEAGSRLAAEGLSVSRGLDETWQAIAADVAALTALARSGRVVATGVPDVVGHLPADMRLAPTEAVCGFCDMAGLCRANGEG